MNSSNARYPIGPVELHDELTLDVRKKLIDDIASLPALIRKAVAGLNDAQLDTPYREGGWTVRQVVHHLADSHLNGYIRLKLSLTEDFPTIKPYEQDKWAELADSKLPVDASLGIIDGVHYRWSNLLRSLSPEQFTTKFRHPEHDKPFTIDRNLCMYAWHGKHHVAHITTLRNKMGW